MGIGGEGQHQGFSYEQCVLEGNHNSRQEIRRDKHPKVERQTSRAAESERKATKDDGDAHATTTMSTDDNHNDIPPKLSPVFSTSLSSPSLLALAKGRKIGLASKPTVARNVGLDIPGEPITGLENAKFGWVKDCI